jgi:tRNA A37 threonylcarbamoyladenosine synthetase subunit TsaC/SUA5/YrdC
VKYRYTKHQVARCARPDFETDAKIGLMKNVSLLRATYQIRLLALKAVETNKKLVLVVPEHCKLHPTLRKLKKELSRTIRVEHPEPKR